VIPWSREGYGRETSRLAFSPDGRRLTAKAGIYGPLTVWDASSGRELHKIMFAKGEALGVLAFDPGHDRVAWNVASGMTIRDLGTGREVGAIPVDRSIGPVGCAAFSRDGSRLALGHFYGAVTIWDAGTGRRLHILPGHNSGVGSVGFDAEGTRVVSA